MPRTKNNPDLIGRRNLEAIYYPPDHRIRWHARLPGGPLVFLGRTEAELKASLSALNQLALLVGNRWRGITAASIADTI